MTLRDIKARIRVRSLVAAICSIFILCCACSAQFIYRHGQKVPLKESSRYLALQLNPGISPELPQFTSMVKGGAVKEIITDSPLLRGKGIVLIDSVGGPIARDNSQPQFTASANEVGTPLKVYELGSTTMILTNEVLFKLEPGNDAGAMEQIQKFGKILKSVNGGFRLQVDKPGSALDVANQISEQNKVRYSEPNFILLVRPRPKIPAKSPAPRPSSAPARFPSDAFFPQQWSFENHSGIGKADSDIHVHSAWNTSNGAGVTIAIIDDGVDTTHADLNQKVDAGQPPVPPKIVKPYDAITGSNNPVPLHWWDRHGTACAGVAAAVTNNIQGMAGVGYQASIMPIRIASTAVNGGAWITSPESIASGINWAVNNGADVVNISWNMDDNPIVESAILEGLTKGRKTLGVVFVMAAGNDGGPVEWPATLAGEHPVIAVSAINEWNELKSDHSSDHEPGWASNFGKEVTVAAPGIHIFTLNVSGSGDDIKGPYYTGFNGTSSAAPHVAGIAALILSKEPGLSAAMVKDRLKATADAIGDSLSFGAGRVNACKAVQRADCSSVSAGNRPTEKHR